MYQTSTAPTNYDAPRSTTDAKSKWLSIGFVAFWATSLLLWGIGFSELATRFSGRPETAIFGLYTPRVVVLLAAYSVGLVTLLVVAVAPRGHIWLLQIRNFVQRRWWCTLLMLATLGLFLWMIVTLRIWRQYPTLQGVLFLYGLLLVGVFLLAGWRRHVQIPWWRKGLVGIAGILIVVEIGLQGMALVGMLPGRQQIDNLFIPYGRVYQNQEGLANGTLNRYGWYYPEFQLDTDAERLLLLGDTFVQALQIPRSEHMGERLESRLNALHENNDYEVMALGMPGFGPGLYLSLTRMNHMIDVFAPDTIVLLFHLSNDFQVITEPQPYELFHEVQDGVVEIHEDSWKERHDLQHLILDGYEPEAGWVLTAQSHFLLPTVLGQLMDQRTVSSQNVTTVWDKMDFPYWQAEVLDKIELDPEHSAITKIAVYEDPGRSNFIFEQEQSTLADNAGQVAMGLIDIAEELAEARGVDFQIVTIPAFPPAFYETNAAEDWPSELGPYDLLLPENRLHEFAKSQGIPFLGMGAHLQHTLSTERIRQLYFRDGVRHLTSAGHDYFAEAIANCLFELSNPRSISSCYLPTN